MSSFHHSFGSQKKGEGLFMLSKISNWFFHAYIYAFSHLKSARGMELLLICYFVKTYFGQVCSFYNINYFVNKHPRKQYQQNDSLWMTF